MQRHWAIAGTSIYINIICRLKLAAQRNCYMRHKAHSRVSLALSALAMAIPSAAHPMWVDDTLNTLPLFWKEIQMQVHTDTCTPMPAHPLKTYACLLTLPHAIWAKLTITSCCCARSFQVLCISAFMLLAKCYTPPFCTASCYTCLLLPSRILKLCTTRCAAYFTVPGKKKSADHPWQQLLSSLSLLCDGHIKQTSARSWIELIMFQSMIMKRCEFEYVRVSSGFICMRKLPIEHLKCYMQLYAV